MGNQAAYDLRWNADDYYEYGLGWLTGAKATAEGVADAAERDASLASEEYKLKEEAVAEKERQIKDAATGAQKAEEDSNAKGAEAKKQQQIAEDAEQAKQKA